MLHHDPRRPLTPKPRDARRELRIPVSLESVMGNTQLGKRKIELLDLSCSGCCVSTVLSLEIGSHVVLTIPDLAPMGAQVRWRRNGSLGLRFNAALHPAVVARVKAMSSK